MNQGNGMYEWQSRIRKVGTAKIKKFEKDWQLYWKFEYRKKDIYKNIKALGVVVRCRERDKNGEAVLNG